MSFVAPYYVAATLLLAAASAAFTQTGTLNGTVTDSSGASIARAQVKLSLSGRAPDQSAEASDAGHFSFANVSPGPYRLTFTAAGFAPKTISGDLAAASEPVILPPTTLVIDILSTAVIVTLTPTEIAQEQIKGAETQRLAGLVPNYFTNFNPDAAPLNAKQKFELTRKTLFDPAAFVITGIIAGIGQANNTHRGFGQGAQGYGKRYGAAYAEWVTGFTLEKTVMPVIFKQDPRYFVKGSGSKSSRFLYAISRSVICQGDNRKAQPCYSSVISQFAPGYITNYFYPAANRNSAASIARDGAIGIGGKAAGNLFREFVSRKITRKKP